ncbi:aspartyl-phosphate phosphatase Spo0E family protein [Thalassorhabdus alkalitolerans]|uniref:Aspartyl-phosphate phosphatase Spo0E family protein n=1 Tax=Thalassorhabdus alkalitolerans TaxID=2282697 RepID=A0ABW0YFG8_9BACI|nr:aspartyl-phosphate phosphatase Spo0E family protein [Thalassobacillus sp. C254]
MKEKASYEKQQVQLEKLREKMVSAALTHGIHHPIVLHYSKQVDAKHNLLMEMAKEQKVNSNLTDCQMV